MRILISNVVCLEPAISPGSLDPVDIGIEDGKISFIRHHSSTSGQEIDPQEAWDRVIQGRGRLALPGFVNAHSHLGMTLLRGYGDDLPLMVWLKEKIWPIEEHLTVEDVYWASLLAIGEMLRGGVTTCADMYVHMEATAKAVAESGIRASLSRGVQDVGGSGAEGLKEAIDFCRRWQGAANGRITTMLGPHAPFTCTPGFLHQVVDWANRLDVPIHTHVAETSAEVCQIKEQYGVTPLRMLAQNGILDLPTTVAHCVHMEKSDLELAAQYGVGVVHCPGSNMKLGSGIAPLPEMLAIGLLVGLGTDGAASNNKLDLWEEMRLASLIHKAKAQDATVIPAATALRMATELGAMALHLDRVGRLSPGWVADVILVDTEGLHWQPPSNPQASIVYAGDRSDVSLVMVDGCIVYEEGELLTIDEDKVAYQVRKSAHDLGLLKGI